MLFVLQEGDYLLICFLQHVATWYCFHYAAMLSGPMAAAWDGMSQFRLKDPVMLNTCRYGESCDNRLP